MKNWGQTMQLGQVLSGAPLWVFGLIAVLIVLGVRRLRTREVPIAVALIPFIAFATWSIIGAVTLATLAGSTTAALAWVAGAIVGGASAFVLPEPRAHLLPGRRVRQPASWLPLTLYMTVFVARFACGALAAILPQQAVTATAIAVAISAVMTARLAGTVARWQRTAIP